MLEIYFLLEIPELIFRISIKLETSFFIGNFTNANKIQFGYASIVIWTFTNPPYSFFSKNEVKIC